MLDEQKQRLCHLVSNAIANLWKKESGSVSSVWIKGTICITSGNGTTHILQLHDSFSGTIPGYGEVKHFNYEEANFGNLVIDEPVEKPNIKRKLDLNKVATIGNTFDNFTNHGSLQKLSLSKGNNSEAVNAIQAYYDDLSPASVVSPTSETSPIGKSISLMNDNNGRISLNRIATFQAGMLHKSNGMDSGIGGDEIDDTVEVDDEQHCTNFSINGLKEEFLSDDDEDVVVADDLDSLNTSRNSSVAGPVCPGTGYYTSFAEDQTDEVAIVKKPKLFQKEDITNNNEIKQAITCDGDSYDLGSTEQTMIDKFSTSDGPGPMMSTPKIRKSGLTPPRLCPPSPGNLNNSFNNSQNDSVLDLTKSRDITDDLALSSPQNYTAQVREVIRQRLMAHKGNSLDDSSLLFTTTTHDIINEAKNNDNSKEETLNLATGNITSKNTVLDVQLPQLKSTPALEGTHSHKLSVKSPLGPPATTALFPGTFHYPVHMPITYKNTLTPYGYGMIAAAQMVRQQANSRHLSPMPPHSDTRTLTLERSLSTPSLNEQPVNLETQDSPSHDVNNISYMSDHSNRSFNDSKETGSSETTQKVYKCDFCSKSFLFKSKYHEHLPVHTNARPFQCRLCSRTYKYKYDLRVHLRTHMGIPTKSTICPFCNAKFDTNKLLRIHIRDAHKERHRVSEDECAQMYEGVL